jgi:hypothetical protein
MLLGVSRERNVIMSHAHVNEDFLMDDPEMRHSLRVIRREHTWRLVAVAFALIAALATAFTYSYLSYSGTGHFGAHSLHK